MLLILSLLPIFLIRRIHIRNLYSSRHAILHPASRHPIYCMEIAWIHHIIYTCTRIIRRYALRHTMQRWIIWGHANASHCRLHVILASFTKNVYKRNIVMRCHWSLSSIWCALTDIVNCFANCDIILHSKKGNSNSKPSRYTELHQDGRLSLYFNSLEEKQAGMYTCKGIYARNVQLTKSVTIDTISEYRIKKPYRILIFKWTYSDIE